MNILKKVELPLASQEDVVKMRQATRTLAVESGFSLVDQTKIVTAASELARNAVIHGRGGSATLEILSDGPRKGLRLIFEDHGPGIADIQEAMRDGFTTGGGLGLGLGGSKRLCNELRIESKVGVGTTVTAVKWSK